MEHSAPEMASHWLLYYNIEKPMSKAAVLDIEFLFIIKARV